MFIALEIQKLSQLEIVVVRLGALSTLLGTFSLATTLRVLTTLTLA